MSQLKSPQARTRLEGTASAAKAIQRVKYSHDAMIDLIIAEPGVEQNRLAEVFGYSVPWVSRVLNSDAFQVALASRKSELIDPTIVASIEERLKTVASKSLDVILNKLNVAPTIDQALKAMELTTKALGYGAKDTSGSTNNFVVHLPQQSSSSKDWSNVYAPPVKVISDITDVVATKTE